MLLNLLLALSDNLWNVYPIQIIYQAISNIIDGSTSFCDYKRANFETMQNQNKLYRFRQLSKSIAIFILLGGLVSIASCSSDYTLPNQLVMEESRSLVEKGKKKETLPELPLPENGYGKFFFESSRTSSKLKFVPHAGTKENMIVKLEDWETGKVVCWFFVREGETFETPIPEGSYRFKIAIGKTWYGEERLFGREASYSSIINNVKIPERTNFTLNLTPSVIGTLNSKKIEAANF